MQTVTVEPTRIRAAWEGRVSGCLLGKPVEVLSFEQGRAGLSANLEGVDALPLRDYVPLQEGSTVDRRARDCCRDHNELALKELLQRTAAVAETICGEKHDLH